MQGLKKSDTAQTTKVNGDRIPPKACFPSSLNPGSTNQQSPKVIPKVFKKGVIKYSTNAPTLIKSKPTLNHHRKGKILS